MPLSKPTSAGSPFAPKGLLLSFLLLLLTACSSTPQSNGNLTQTTDPFEPVNRKIFKFNDTLDRYVLRPVAKGYARVTPQVVQTGVGNFFSNLDDVGSAANSLLQGKVGEAGNDTGRFLINSTVGLVGLIDVASKAGLPKNDGEDFGQTLAVWGVKSGPFLMLPLFGPATVRDGSGMIVDRFADPLYYLESDPLKYGLGALDVVDTRVQLMQAESFLTGDVYILLRDAYLQRRQYLIKDGEVEDDFGGDYDDYGDYGDYE